MSENRRESVGVGGSPIGNRLPPSEEVLEARRDGDTVQCIPTCHRLLRVLIVDDYPDTADSLSMLVTAWGHDVRLAYDGAAALELAEAYRPDVLLLDVVMPKLNGFRLAQLLRQQARFQDTLLIAVTGYGDPDHRLLWEKAFDHYLVKPVEPSTLETLLMLEHDRLASSPEAPPVTPPEYGPARAVRGMLNVGLQNPGFAAWLAGDGQEALTLYRRHRRAHRRGPTGRAHARPGQLPAV